MVVLIKATAWFLYTQKENRYHL